MNLAEWILVMFLSVALLIFLIVGIVFLVKFTSLLSEIEIMGQSIFDKADDVADNIKDLTSVGPLAKGFVTEYIGRKLFNLLKIDRKPKKSYFDEFEEEDTTQQSAKRTATKATKTPIKNVKPKARS